MSIVQNYPQGYINAGVSGQARSEPVKESSIVKESSVVQSDYVSRLQSKLRAVEDKIDNYRDKIRSGKSDSQTMIQYQRAIERREELQKEIKDYKKAEDRARSGEGYGVEKTLVEPSNVASTPEPSITSRYSSQGVAERLGLVKNEQVGLLVKMEENPAGFELVKRNESEVVGVKVYTLEKGGEIKSTNQYIKEVPKELAPGFVEIKKAPESNIPSGTVQASSEVFGKPSASQQITRVGQELLTKGQLSNSDMELYTLAGGGILLVKGVGESIASIPEFFSPITYKGEFQIPIVSPIYRTGKSLISGEVRTFAEENPAEFTGQLIGMGLGGKIFDIATTKIKNVYVKTGSEFIPPEEVFAKQVLSGESQFPTVRYVQESLSQFRQSEYVITASPSKIKGLEAGEGAKGSFNLEDPGIFVSARGEASPAFLGLSESEYSLSLNPVAPIIQIFREPTLTEFKVAGVSRQPLSVLLEPGFTATRAFFESEGSLSGKAYLTKRSEVGLGEIPRQFYKAVSDYKSPFEGGQTVIRDSRILKTEEIKAGDILREAGTSEPEAVIPITAKFKYTPTSWVGKFKGYESYTIYEGRAIPIRSAELLAGEGAKVSKLSVAKVNFGFDSRVISGERVLSESSRTLGNRVRNVYPYDYSVSKVASVSEPISVSKLSSTSELTSVSKVASVSEPVSVSKLSSTSELTSVSKVASVSEPVSVSKPSSVSYLSTSKPITPTSYPNVGSRDRFIYPYPSSIKRKGDKDDKRFKLLIRQKGKFRPVAVGDVEELELRGQSILRGSLRASYKIQSSTGETVQVQTPSGFTRSKRESGVIVQPRGLRLSSFGERAEIRQARFYR